jgi:hypothetical protein
VVSAALARDARRVAARSDAAAPLAGAVERIRWDLANARTITAAGGGRWIIMIGHGGTGPKSLKPTGRLTRVTYEVRSVAASSRAGVGEALVRRQEYLDDPIDRQPWTEIVATDITGVEAVPASGGVEPVREEPALQGPVPRAVTATGVPSQALTIATPSRVTVRLESAVPGGSIAQEVWTR